MVPRRLALAALFTVLALPAFALDYRLGAIEIGQPWARATPSTAEAGGGFLVITNTGTTPDRLIAVKSPAADKVEIHEMKMDGNIMRMREVEKGIEIPPGATVELKPGGFHRQTLGPRTDHFESCHGWARAALPSPKRSRFGFAQAGPVARHGLPDRGRPVRS